MGSRSLPATLESHTPDTCPFFPEISGKYLDRAVLSSYWCYLTQLPRVDQEGLSLGMLKIASGVLFRSETPHDAIFLIHSTPWRCGLAGGELIKQFIAQ